MTRLPRDKRRFNNLRHYTTVAFEGEASGSVTSVPLSVGGGMELALGSVGMPVEVRKVARKVAISWMSDNAPGDWTVTLWKRDQGGSAWASVASLPLTTS